MLCATSIGSDQPAHTRSLIRAFAGRLNIKLLTEQEFLCLKGSCTGLSESTLVKMPHCWKSHVTAHYMVLLDCNRKGPFIRMTMVYIYMCRKDI